MTGSASQGSAFCIAVLLHLQGLSREPNLASQEAYGLLTHCLRLPEGSYSDSNAAMAAPRKVKHVRDICRGLSKALKV